MRNGEGTRNDLPWQSEYFDRQRRSARYRYSYMSNASKYLIVISGATAVGKTRMAIEVAKFYETEIVSADSRQFYRELEIGTAKPTPAELDAVPHHFIDHLSIHDTYTVGDYEREALALLDRLFETHDKVVLTGGSGLFIDAVIRGLDKFPVVPEGVKRQIALDLNEHGLPQLLAELKTADPAYYEEVDRQNPARITRALGVIRASGQPFSSFRRGAFTRRPFVPVLINLVRPRAELYTRIDQRVDQMVAEGLLEEAFDLAPYQELGPLQTVGYQEWWPHFRGEQTKEETITLIKRNTRRYAKRQLTWFRRHPHWKHFTPDVGQLKRLLAYIQAYIEVDLRIHRMTEAEAKRQMPQLAPSPYLKLVGAWSQKKFVGAAILAKRSAGFEFQEVVLAEGLPEAMREALSSFLQEEAELLGLG